LHDVLNGVVASGLVNTDESIRYVDPDLKPQAPGEISRDAVAKIKAEIAKVLLSDQTILDWLGHSVTESYTDVDLRATAQKTSASGVPKLLRKSRALVRAEGSRLAYIKKPRGISFFDNGRRCELTGKVAELGQALADRIVVPVSSVEPLLRDSGCKRFVAELLSSGAIVIDAD
jgi:ribosomal protein L16 Arg81 hydroxylase